MPDRPSDPPASADTFARARAIFEAALEAGDAGRDRILQDRCGSDGLLRATVDRMLQADGAPHGLLDGSPLLVADRWTEGDTFAHFRIGELIGRGGMGEVYQARDLSLNRDVALKVLPADGMDLPGADDRSRRLHQEAQTLAAFNHPNIATIHGLVEADGTRALVLELVDGPTLAARLADGPMPIDEAVACARQIAGALEAAHERGIVHRDLKPANVTLRPDGAVKLLDFGLAQVANAAGTASSEPAGGLAGTAAYVSPEQVRGREGDRRSDIWSFGATVFEMLTGAPAFTGRDVPETLAAVTTGEIAWATLPATTPQPLRQLLVRCLDRDVTRRLRDIGEARIVLDDLLDGTADAPVPPPVERRRWTRLAVPAAVLLAGGALAAATLWRRAPPTPPPVTRFSLSLPADRSLQIDPRSRDLAIAPDGSRIVYKGGTRIDRTHLFVQRLDGLEPEPITAAGMPKGPFVSPDGQWVGYFEPGPPGAAFKMVPITGGPPILVSRLDGPSSGATWIDDRTVVAASAAPATGLLRLSADGGDAVVLTRPDRGRGEADHLWPHALPGGRHVLFTVTALSGGLDAAQIAVLDLAAGTWRPVLPRGRQPHYLPSGHLVYVAGGALWAVGFDATRGEVLGAPRVAVPQVVTLPTGVAEYDVGGDGTLVYVAGETAPSLRTLVWVDPQGREEPLDAPPRAYANVRLSPDGTRIATEIEGDGHDIWVWDVAGRRLTRVTTDPGTDQAPVWMPDGRRLVFKTEADGALGALAMQAADGSGSVERLLDSGRVLRPSATLADGSGVFFSDGSGPKLLRLDAGRSVSSLLDLPRGGGDGRLSPDGRWIAYTVLDTRTPYVFVSPFPAANSGRTLVTPAGGSQPRWAPDGRTLYFTALDGTLMSTRTALTAAFTSEPPMQVLTKAYFGGITALSRTGTFDVSPDGRRFLMIKETADDATQRPRIVVVRNWHEELARLVPARP
jgi:eukaryotic-like serine/threonine-protein kinase